jgi:hypothetical protein
MRDCMTFRRAILFLALLCAIASFAACSLLFPTWTYRYRLNVEVEQAGKVYGGSSVIEVRRGKGINGIGAQVTGEAVAVDLGEGNTLFAILWGPDGNQGWPYWIAHKAFAERLGTVDMVNEGALTRLTGLKDASATLSHAEYPMLVRFRDINEPRSIEAVSPNNPTASFGVKTIIKRISIQITNDPPNKTISKRLKWLESHNGSLVYDNKIHPDSPEKDVNRFGFMQDR